MGQIEMKCPKCDFSDTHGVGSSTNYDYSTPIEQLAIWELHFLMNPNHKLLRSYHSGED